jgi:hypothetical protein
MRLIETLTDVTGMAEAYADFIREIGLGSGHQIVYYGVPGRCVPFILAKAYAVRKLGIEQVFVPVLQEALAKKITEYPGIGMQVSTESAALHPDVVTLMGGLAMPDMNISPDDVLKVISRYNARITGSCHANLFSSRRWTRAIEFDLLIDSTIDPVYIWRK